MKLIILSFLLFLNTGCTDSWKFPKELNDQMFTFGKTEVHRIIDARENNRYPIYRLEIKYNDKLEANIKNLTFDKMVSFGKGEYLLGLSNSGLSTFAYFIISNQGDLAKTVNHSKNIHYCKESITVTREWVNLNKINLREEYETIENNFDKENPYVFLKSVVISGCNGKDIKIL